MAATTTWKTRTVTLGDATVTKIRDTYTMCNDWITAPTGKIIQIRVTALKDVRCKNGCTLSAIEPKVIANKAMTSPRICCPGQLNQILPSKINPTPVVTYNLQHTSTFTYQYSICCPGQLNQILSSKINPTPVVTYNLQHTSTFTYQYRYI
ncbi:hypothetical protein COOONC_17623 [Cooperia oncophora]